MCKSIAHTIRAPIQQPAPPWSSPPVAGSQAERLQAKPSIRALPSQTYGRFSQTRRPSVHSFSRTYPGAAARYSTEHRASTKRPLTVPTGPSFRPHGTCRAKIAEQWLRLMRTKCGIAFGKSSFYQLRNSWQFSGHFSCANQAGGGEPLFRSQANYSTLTVGRRVLQPHSWRLDGLHEHIREHYLRGQRHGR